MTRLKLGALIPLLLGGMIAASATAAPFTNGSFESPGGANEVSLNGNPTYVTAWTASGTGMFYEGAGNSHGWTAHTGSYGVSFGHDGTAGTLSQTFDTTPGRIYTVTYFIRRIQGGTSTQVITAKAFDGASGTSLEAVQSGIPAANDSWFPGAILTFTAASATSQIRFTGQHVPGQTDDANCALDTVRVVEAPPVAVNALHNFAEPGALPAAALLRASDGSFYGTTQLAGARFAGTVFRLTPTGSGFETTTVHNFAEGQPASDAALIDGGDGSFYGTTRGPEFENGGTAIRLTPNSNGRLTVTTLHTFPREATPSGRLLLMSDGSLYGTTAGGGTNRAGTLFKLTPDGNGGFTHATVFSFHFSSSGSRPVGVILGRDGNLYGATAEGGLRDQFGNGGFGTVYKIAPNGSNFTLLRSFSQADGINPSGELVEGVTGVFYGVNQNGGPNDGVNDPAGTIFRITSTGTFTLLHRFTGGAATENGLRPRGGLIRDADGAFYGTTIFGGSVTTNEPGGRGTVFKMSVSEDTATVTTLHRFTGAPSQGAEPQSGVVLGGDGFLYGTTAYGGLSRGTAFRVSLTGTSYETLTRFAPLGGRTPDGLVEGRDGNFYGTTSQGGTEDKGTVFKLTPAGVKTVLHSFSGPDGNFPHAALVQGRDGNFYGTTEAGGSVDDDAGVLFKLTPNADGSSFTFTRLHVFTYAQGGYPAAALLEDRERDGEFYGVAQYGGTSGNYGIIFKVIVNGTGAAFTVLHNFVEPDGGYPAGDLIQGTDGLLYGTAPNFGPGDQGTIFRLTRDGSGFTVLHSFTGEDGSYPAAGLRQAGNGSFYGVAAAGGQHGVGTVFRLTPDANGSSFSLSVLHTFSFGNGGHVPLGELTLGSDGDLYGTTRGQGTTDPLDRSATIFRISTADDSFARMHSFDPLVVGTAPEAALITGRDGNLYGTTPRGGSEGAGSVFRVVIQPVITSNLTASDRVGAPFSYQITAANGPVSYSASGLPLGLAINSSTGAITGTPQCSGTYTVQLSATNSAGTDTKTLLLAVAPPAAPVMTGPAEGPRTNRTPVLTGTSQPGNAIVVTITGGSSPVTLTTTSDSNGNFSVDSPQLAEGSYSVSAVVRYCNDAESSARSNTRNFTVDTTPPVISNVPGNIRTTATESDGAFVTYNSPTASDAVSGNVPVSCSPASGSKFPTGTTTVTCSASDAAGNAASASFTVTVEAATPTPTPSPSATPSATPAQPVNIATRVNVGTGSNVMIGGFIITGSAEKKVILRGIGPSTGVDGALADPVLELNGPDGFASITNDNWEESQKSEIERSGIAPKDPREAAIVVTLPPGAYTGIVRGRDNTTGIGVVEVYDLSLGAPSQLANISTRGFVQTDDSVIIGGFILGGSAGDEVNVIVRAIGPSLANAGLTNALPNPALDIRDQDGNPVASNNDWQDDPNAAKVAQNEVAPTNEREAALYLSLPAGQYTAIVSGEGSSTGVGLVEIYHVE